MGENIWIQNQLKVMLNGIKELIQMMKIIRKTQFKTAWKLNGLDTNL